MTQLLQPLTVLILWSMIMWIWLYATRIPAMRAAKIDLEKRSGGTGKDLDGILPANVQWKAHNYNHLMEQPTLFYAVIFALLLLGDVSHTTLMLAWAYVALRIVHSLVQAIWNKIIVRFSIFAIASLALLMLAIRAVALAFNS
ncbi:MAPEG family protein [Sphingomicrobium nitratireducens]|uniref:MAPEG family protein n=1 Tax=Sphingomicrobium nitratireducens TaxID=2964666 RepID=UPI00223F9447|nr:MAPEG family protein [Sphingomicrobium nitratireducens]